VAEAAAGPLAGVRVVDLTINVLGPQATQILGDMGAEVIKVEAPGGDPMRQMGPARHSGMGAFFLALNRNKKSVVLDLKQAQDRDTLLRLAAGADVFVHSMRAKAAARLGIAYADIRRVCPEIVYAWAGGYARHGPLADRPAYDDVIQGESGLAGLIQRATGRPGYVPMPLADKLCGYVLASAVAMALFARERTGKGQEVHVPMLETMLGFNLVEHLWHGVLDQPEKGLGYARVLAPDRRPYATADGHICLMVNTDQQWRRLMAAVGRPEVMDDARFSRLDKRTENIGALLEVLANALSARTTAEWRERLDAADVPNAPMASLEDIVASPYLAETGYFRRFEHPSEGPMMTTAIPVDFSKTPGALRLPPPCLGEHNEEIWARAAVGDDAP
jgi:crotonobetainyl-CoA:carnitine CoA-transferase CaiB-like acyl-CoA transferase